MRSHILNQDGSVLLYRIDKALDKTNWVRVLMVSADCENISPDLLKQYKVFMQFPERDRRMGKFEMVGDDLFIVHESLMDENYPSLKPIVYLLPLTETADAKDSKPSRQ